jgi:hypothetical protein
MMEKGKNIIMNATDAMKKTGNTILDYRYIIFMFFLYHIKKTIKRDVLYIQ